MTQVGLKAAAFLPLGKSLALPVSNWAGIFRQESLRLNGKVDKTNAFYASPNEICSDLK